MIICYAQRHGLNTRRCRHLQPHHQLLIIYIDRIVGLRVTWIIWIYVCLEEAASNNAVFLMLIVIIIISRIFGLLWIGNISIWIKAL